MLLLSLGACKKARTQGASKNPTPPPNNPTPEPPIPPLTISSVAIVSSSIFGPNDIVDLVVTFNEPVKITGVPSLTLSVGGSPTSAYYQDKGEPYSLTHTFLYTVEDGHSGSIQVTGLSVDLSNFISDEAENPTEGNIQAPLLVSGVTVDAIPPIISSVAKVSSATLFGHNAIVDLVVTFNEPVKIAGVPNLILSVGGSPASAGYQDKGESYSLTHTFRYIVGNGHSGSIQVTGLSVDLSNSIRDEAENPTAENIQAPLSVSGVTVEARSCDYTVTSGFNGGSGSESSPYLICTYAQLDKMRDNLMAHYELGQDINANPSWSAGDNGCTAYDGSTVPETTPCTGWVPVGTFENNKCDGGTDDVCFQGHLDGGDHVISNLYLNISDSGTKYGGLFGYTGSQTEISNMGLTNASMTVTSSAAHSYSYSGGLVGYNYGGTISNSYATGEVTSSASASASSNSYSFGGGLVGYNYGETLSNSYATGEVTSSASYSYSGGLVGYNGGTLSGTNYFVDNSGTNGIGSGTCSGTCAQKTLTQLQALISTDVTDWSTDNWDFGTTTQLPRVKYAPTATYCSDNTYTTQQTCEDASESWVIEGCDGDTGVTCGDVIPGQ